MPIVNYAKESRMFALLNGISLLCSFILNFKDVMV